MFYTPWLLKIKPSLMSNQRCWCWQSLCWVWKWNSSSHCCIQLEHRSCKSSPQVWGKCRSNWRSWEKTLWKCSWSGNIWHGSWCSRINWSNDKAAEWRFRNQCCPGLCWVTCEILDKKYFRWVFIDYMRLLSLYLLELNLAISFPFH